MDNQIVMECPKAIEPIRGSRIIPKIRMLLWGVVCVLFAGVGMVKIYRAVDARVFPSTPEYVSADAYLLATVGVPKASEKIVALMSRLPARVPVIFVGGDDVNSNVTSGLVNSLSPERKVWCVSRKSDGEIELPQGITPAAIFLYGVEIPAFKAAGVKIGRLTFVQLQNQ